MHDLTMAAVETASAGLVDEPVLLPRLFDGPDLDWMLDGVCAQTDPEAFFPEKGGSTREAKAMCARCDVADLCLEYALDNDERHGIWGGLSERERRRVKAARRAGLVMVVAA